MATLSALQRLVFILGLVILATACGGGDDPPSDGDDVADGDVDDQTQCSQGDLKCIGDNVYSCGSTNSWEIAQSCPALGANYICLYGQCQLQGDPDGDVDPDGDLDETTDGDTSDGDVDGDADGEVSDREPDADPDGDLDMDADTTDGDSDGDLADGDLDVDFDLDAEADAEIEEDMDLGPVIHLCAENDQYLGDPCFDDADCADLCQPEVGDGCWACGDDMTCAPADPGTASCFEGDPDPEIDEKEEDEPWDCTEADPWYCDGNLLYYCAGGDWASIDCADNGQTCEPNEGGAACGGTAIDGDIDGDSDGAGCVPNLSAGRPILQVDGSGLDYAGLIPGQLLIRSAEICNAGSLPLRVSAIHLVDFAPSIFSVFMGEVSLPITLQPGDTHPVNIAARAPYAGDFTQKLVIVGNDPLAPAQSLDLAVGISPRARVIISPSSRMAFSGNSGNSLSFTVRNDGDAAASLGEALIVGGGGNYYLSDESIAGPLQPGQSRSQSITELGDNDVGELVIPVSCTACGISELRIALNTTPGNECPEASLPPAWELPPLAQLVLDGSYSTNPDGALPLYRWSWDAKPTPAVAADFRDETDALISGIWSDTAMPWVFFDQAGSYTARLSLNDGGGQSCDGADTETMAISAVPTQALYISLTALQAGRDLDLHLVRPGATFSRDNADNTGDCHFANCHTDFNTDANCPARGCPGPANAPDWGVVGVRWDDPMLLRIDDGRGPEAISLDQFETGEYRVVVENVDAGVDTDFEVHVWVYGQLLEEISGRITGGTCVHETVALITAAQTGAVNLTTSNLEVPSGCD